MRLRFDQTGVLPATLRPEGGRWVVRDGACRQEDAAEGPCLALAADRSWDRYRVRTRVRFADAAGQEAGLVLNARDGQNYLLLTLRQRKGGLYLVLRIQLEEGYPLVGDQAPAAIDPTEWHELAAEVAGTDIVGYLDGQRAVDFSFAAQPPTYYTHEGLWKANLTGGNVGFYTRGAAAAFDGLEVRGLPAGRALVTPQKPRRDAEGRLRPRQSYADTLRQYTEWFFRARAVTDMEGVAEVARDWEPYCVSSFTFVDDRIGTDIQYPGHNHPPIITGFLEYTLFTGDQRGVEAAKALADWNLAHSTPADWALPYLPLSHFALRSQGVDCIPERNFEMDKAAFMGSAYLRLHAMTGEPRYLEAAERLGRTLQRAQRPEGNWPFRVSARDGAVEALYTCSLIWYVRFFEALAERTDQAAYQEVRDRAFRWLMENPVRTNQWQGFYGDIPSGTASYDQWTALDTASYLIDHRDRDPGYLSIARGIVDWVNQSLVVPEGYHAGVPGLLEQSTYKVILSHHQIRLAEVYARLWGATGESRYRDLATEIANSVTWLLMSDGKMRMGFWYHAQCDALVLSFNEAYCRIMAEIPETAPRGETHLLHHTSEVRRIDYRPDGVTYETLGPGSEVLTLVRRPRAVRAEGLSTTDGWTYDPGTRVLRVRHGGERVEVEY